MAFKPFCDYFASWMPPGITDKDYIIAQYDGAVAYMDAASRPSSPRWRRWASWTRRSSSSQSDHGETLYDHDCYFDHHGLYDVTLHVPLILRYPGKVPAGKRVGGYSQHNDLVPTLLDLAGIESGIQFDGQQPAAAGARRGRVAPPRVLHHRVHLDAQARLAHAAVEADRRAGAGFPLQAAGRALQPGRGPRRRTTTWPRASRRSWLP